MDSWVFVLLLVSLTLVVAEEFKEQKKNKRGIYGESLGYGLGGGLSLGAGSGLGSYSGLGLGTASGLGVASAPAISLEASSLSGGLYSGGASYGAGAPTLISKHIQITNRYGVPVPQPYPVTVERQVPVPVPHPVHYPVSRPYPVPVPHPVAVPVEKPVAVPVDKPVPYPVPHPVAVPVPRPVAVPVPRPVAVPVIRNVAVPVPHPVAVHKPVLVGSLGVTGEALSLPSASYGVGLPSYDIGGSYGLGVEHAISSPLHSNSLPIEAHGW